MADIASTTIKVNANSVELESDLRKAGAHVSRFAAGAKNSLQSVNLRDYAEGVGRVREAFASFSQLDFSDPIRGLQSMKAALEAAAFSAKSLRSALVITGVGAALAGIGALLSAMTPAARAPTPLEAFFREREGMPATAEGGGIAGHVTMGHAAGAASRLAGTGAAVSIVDRLREGLGEAGPRMADIARSTREAAADALGGGTAERWLAEATARREAILAVGDAAVISSRSFREMSRDIEDARRSMAVMASTRAASTLRGMAESARHTADTFGMSSTDAAIHRITGGRSLGEIAAERMRTSPGVATVLTDVTRMAAAIDSIRAAGERLAAAERSERRAGEAAAIMDADAGPFGGIGKRIGSIRRLVMSGDLGGTEGMRAVGRELFGLGGSMPEIGRNAPSALMMGTSAAIAEANRLTREVASASMDPIERVRMAIEHLTDVADRERRATEEIGRALATGVLVLPAPRR